MAILIYRMNKPNSTKLEDFDKEYSQAKRIRVLQEESLIEDNSAKDFLLIHESPLTDALFLLVSKSDEVTTT